MRKWATLLVFAGTAWPALAAKSLTVEQLGQMLDTLRGKPDAKVAQQLSEVELTERVNPAKLARWEAAFAGSRTREELTKLADAAAFLNPPAADVLRIAPPDPDTQEKMMSVAADYVKTTITRLPNFYAKRETIHFEDEPSREQVEGSGMGSAGWRNRPVQLSVSRSDPKPLHVKETYSATVTYRDGSEVHETDKVKDAKADQVPSGFTTSGEFGPILSVVVGDALRSQVTWLRWEQGATDPVAVFRYAVPVDQSNYSIGIPNGGKFEHVFPGYHGEIAIDPASGAILRLSFVAELEPPYQAIQTATMVEYATVEIGDREYICPVHGAAFSKVPVGGAAQDTQGSIATMQTQLNDVTFTEYHLFASEAHIVADEGGKKDATPPAAANATPAADSGDRGK
jgi:hypothetical protein